jgi:hypothetical protein
MNESDPRRPADPDDIDVESEDAEVDGYNRDPGATPDEAGVPEVADDMSPGTGEVAEPELASMPTEVPVESAAHGTTAREQAEDASLENRLAAEQPDLDSPERRPADAAGPMHLEEEPPDS